MNTYLLLRDNHETGPHSLEELKALSLRNLDLIWVEGVSEHWDYATEFAELKPFIAPSHPNFRKNVAHIPPPKSAIRNEPSALAGVSAKREPAAFAMRTVEKAVTPLTERPATAQTFQFPQRRNRGGSLWILSLLLMLMFGAFIVKKLVDDRAQQALVQSAFIALAKEKAKEDKEAGALTFQHAISKEEVAKPVKKAAKTANLKEIKSKIHLSNNEYKVKLFGGVNDLQINVTNGSAETLQAVGIQIRFLKPNGKIIRTENHSVYSLGPKSTKILVVPPTKRGVKIDYSITNVALKSSKILVRKA
jgi:hypothetical protein